MSTFHQIRARLAQARSDLARTEGEGQTLQGELDGTLGKLRELLACKPGQERAAVEKLQAEIAADTAEVSTLLDQAEAAKALPAPGVQGG